MNSAAEFRAFVRGLANQRAVVTPAVATRLCELATLYGAEVFEEGAQFAEKRAAKGLT